MSTQYLLAMPGGSEWILILLALAYLIFWIKTLIEIVNSTFNDQATKIIWFLVVFFGSPIGILIYYIAGKNSTIANQHQRKEVI